MFVLKIPILLEADAQFVVLCNHSGGVADWLGAGAFGEDFHGESAILRNAVPSDFEWNWIRR